MGEVRSLRGGDTPIPRPRSGSSSEIIEPDWRELRASYRELLEKIGEFSLSAADLQRIIDDAEQATNDAHGLMLDLSPDAAGQTFEGVA